MVEYAPMPGPAIAAGVVTGAGIGLLQGLLATRIRADGLERTLRIRRPSLPRQVNRVSVEHLRVGDAYVDLLFERVAHRTESVALTDVKVDGQLDVVLEILRAPGHEPRGRDPLDPTGSGAEPQATTSRR